MSCGSEARLPSRGSAEGGEAEIMQCSMRICCCCTVETSVQWPCRTMSRQERMLASLEVKGAAIEASPSLTMGVPTSASSSSAMPGVLSASAAPYFCASACFSLFSSACMRATTAGIAPSCALKPVSPRRARASISSLSHCGCSLAISAFRLANSAACSLAIATRSAMPALPCAASAASEPAASPPPWPAPPPPPSPSSSCAPPLISFRSTLALPKPERSETPTSADLSAPTSLPPSPHMSVALPCSRIARITHVGRLERAHVVAAVAAHERRLAVLAHRPDHRLLALGAHARVHAHLARDGPRRRLHRRQRLPHLARHHQAVALSTQRRHARRAER